ncbi:MAG: hypothetical protein KF886_17550 [Candidatus Hydrogenedentes bacterium]|nr:hypothetical protein [Candidatus Hydrogenedentota bacterium]
MTESYQTKPQSASVIDTNSKLLQTCVFARNLIRAIAGIVALFVAVAVCVLLYRSASENFEPKAEHVLATESWKPFLQRSTHFSDALRNMDDGSIVLILHLDASDWDAYLDAVAADALPAGWSRTPDTDGRWAERPYHIRARARKLVRKYSDTDGAARVYFTRQMGPDEPDWYAGEVVELTRLEKSGNVMFVSFYR